LDSFHLNSTAISSDDVMTAFLQPKITARAAGNQVTLSWPDWASTMQLYGSTNLSEPASWTAVTNQATTSNGFFSVTLPVTGTRFHRLQWP
jgi:hypothetical protein